MQTRYCLLRMYDEKYNSIYEIQNSTLNELQEKIKNSSVCVIGLGGIGSSLCQSLSHLGVRKFTIIDHDVIEPSNTTRLVGSNLSNVGDKKTTVIQKMIQHICNYTANIDAITQEIKEDTYDEIFGELKVDYIFGCVDKLLPRQYINRFAVCTKTPYIDSGLSIQREGSKITVFRGQVIFIKPGEPCLMCRGSVNNKLNYGEHSAPFIQANAILANIAATEFCKHVTGMAKNHIYTEYDILNQKFEPREFCKLVTRCNICKL